MPNRSPNFFKRLFLDIAGVLLIITAGLVGWLPGPLGIPLFIAGLSLLAINHEWAERWLDRAKSGGLKLIDHIFVDKPIIKWALDFASVGLVSLSTLIFMNRSGRFWQAAAVLAGFAGIAFFLGNRKRLSHLAHFVRRLS